MPGFEPFLEGCRSFKNLGAGTEAVSYRSTTATGSGVGHPCRSLARPPRGHARDPAGLGPHCTRSARPVGRRGPGHVLRMERSHAPHASRDGHDGALALIWHRGNPLPDEGSRLFEEVQGPAEVGVRRHPGIDKTLNDVARQKADQDLVPSAPDPRHGRACHRPGSAERGWSGSLGGRGAELTPSPPRRRRAPPRPRPGPRFVERSLRRRARPRR